MQICSSTEELPSWKWSSYRLLWLSEGPMLKRKLQVPSSTFALKNSARDKWPQQSNPAEDCSCCTRPTDAACDSRTQSAACGKVPIGLGTNTSLGYGSYMTPLSHGMSLVPSDILPSTQVLVPGSQSVTVQNCSSSSSPSQKMQRTDKLEVCREFQRGNCARGETDCRFAHPSDSPMIDTTDNTVTVCMDYIKSRCSREKCKYFHPPAHLQAKIKSNQQQVNQSAVAAQAAAVAFPHSLLQSLPKRQALEKSSWASSLLSPSFLHYQHALANAHLQHPTTAYYPTGSVFCMTPANSVDHPQVTTRNRSQCHVAAVKGPAQPTCKYSVNDIHHTRQAACW